jgi:phytoene dehydrogenase-like protein
MDMSSPAQMGRQQSEMARETVKPYRISRFTPDVAVVGAGPNGLAAAITLARRGRKPLVFEAAATIGGGTRSSELTLPGFIHDDCSAIHPLGLASPFFRGLPLAQFGLAWINPPAALAHPLDDGTAILVTRSVAETAACLAPDAAAYARLMAPLVTGWQGLLGDVLGPLRLPHHPIGTARFGVLALLPAMTLARLAFRGPRARALFAGMAGHSLMPLSWPATSAFGLLLGLLAHAVGWPMARGGSQNIADTLAAHLRSLGGESMTNAPIRSLDDLPRVAAALFDVTPRQLVTIAGESLPAGYRDRLLRYRYGPGVCKVDYALDGPIPWAAAECFQAGTVHLGGTLEQIAAGEAAVWRGEHPAQPFVLLAQQTLFDPSRAPEGKHTAWAYCHVPHGSQVDMSAAIEAQIERFAPGFRQRILARSTRNAVAMEQHNPNYIGGDINGGVPNLRQIYTRPVARLDPYSTPAAGVYLCSSATPPGGGVHGMCGYYAARSALHRMR